MKYFLAVACEKHISRAAERCNVSQPSLSRAIPPEFSPPGLGVEMRPLCGLEARREVCLAVAAGRQKAPLVAAFVQSLRAAEWLAGSIYRV